MIESVSESMSVAESEVSHESTKRSDSVSTVESNEATSESAFESTSELLNATKSVVPVQTEEPTQLAKNDYMAFCPYCGAHLEKGAKFCPNCGSDLTKGKKRTDHVFAKNLKKSFTDNIYPKFSNLYKKTRKKIIIVTGIAVCLILGFLIYGHIKDNTIDLKDAYHDYCKSEYATLSNDGTSLMIDTNPDDLDDGDPYFEEDAFHSILKVNHALGFPDSVATRMNETRSVDGTQSYETKDYLVTWHYHPDQGLEVVYSEK
jgi:hypothetical protein